MLDDHSSTAVIHSCQCGHKEPPYHAHLLLHDKFYTLSPSSSSNNSHHLINYCCSLWSPLHCCCCQWSTLSFYSSVWPPLHLIKWNFTYFIYKYFLISIYVCNKTVSSYRTLGITIPFIRISQWWWWHLEMVAGGGACEDGVVLQGGIDSHAGRWRWICAGSGSAVVTNRW